MAMYLRVDEYMVETGTTVAPGNLALGVSREESRVAGWKTHPPFSVVPIRHRPDQAGWGP